MAIEVTNIRLAALAMCHPEAARVLRERGLDFCRHDDRSLDEVCRELGIDPNDVVRALEALEALPGPTPFDDLRALSLPALAAFVQDHYHANLHALLAELFALATEVETRYFDHPACPRGILERIRTGANELELHMWREESVLFPAVRRGLTTQLAGPADVLRREHDRCDGLLGDLRTLAHGFVPPEGACRTWLALYVGLADLEKQLLEHILVENELLFRRLCEPWG